MEVVVLKIKQKLPSLLLLLECAENVNVLIQEKMIFFCEKNKMNVNSMQIFTFLNFFAQKFQQISSIISLISFFQKFYLIK